VEVAAFPSIQAESCECEITALLMVVMQMTIKQCIVISENKHAINNSIPKHTTTKAGQLQVSGCNKKQNREW
jgi:hypothetical protein